MRETQFIRQNQDKWREFEQILEGEDREPDQLRDFFVQITDDLSYSRTFYPNRSVRVYLNGLAQGIFLKIYRSRRTALGQLITFWTDELPEEIYRARQAFRLSFFLFVLCFGIGMLSCAMDTEFAEVVLGDSYVEMTRVNIESGDPMRVYKERGRFGMFLGITLNNLYVAFLAFALGVFFGVGSMIVLISNAIMVGCFQYFFIAEGLFWESFLTIWIHGTLEISAIVIASAAGITMGQGLAFPGTYTRLQAFQQSARRGAKIMLGATPLFIIAGFLEGYLTRQTETPDMMRGLFILLCLSFVLVYFVWYPWFRKRLNLAPPTDSRQHLSPSRDYSLDKSRIKRTGELASEAFTLFGRHLGWLMALALGSAL
ncbi:MAG: stage II sporulation protein M, partial [Bacteroidetes bacterium]